MKKSFAKRIACNRQLSAEEVGRSSFQSQRCSCSIIVKKESFTDHVSFDVARRVDLLRRRRPKCSWRSVRTVYGGITTSSVTLMSIATSALLALTIQLSQGVLHHEATASDTHVQLITGRVDLPLLPE